MRHPPHWVIDRKMSQMVAMVFVERLARWVEDEREKETGRGVRAQRTPQ
jgi:hypothetical protein